MKQIIPWTAFLLTLVCTPAQPSAVPPGEATVFQLQEFHRRSGLPNVFHKIATQRQVRIGYIGGSITAAKEGWRDLTFGWFRTTFPQTAFYQVDACIGGTRSTLGVFRMERDMLLHQPDLLFVEFAVNDNGLSREENLRSMEGIIRKAWSALPQTDICFVYTTAGPFVPDLAKGKPRPASEAMEELAQHYQIPSIHVGMEVARLYALGKLVIRAEPEVNARTIVFTQDNTHPLPESGHPLYAGVVTKYLAEMSRGAADKARTLPPSYVHDHWEKAHLVEVQKTKLEGDWETLNANHEMMQLPWARFTPALSKGRPGAVMRFRFSGKVLGFFDAIGPGVGIIEIVVDGLRREINRFDAHCLGNRPHAFFIDDLRDGLHQVEVRVTGSDPGKAQIMKGRKEKVDVSEARFRETAWYPANLMIVGEIVD